MFFTKELSLLPKILYVRIGILLNSRQRLSFQVCNWSNFGCSITYCILSLLVCAGEPLEDDDFNPNLPVSKWNRPKNA